jgi:hypothetical protein
MKAIHAVLFAVLMLVAWLGVGAIGMITLAWARGGF